MPGKGGGESALSKTDPVSTSTKLTVPVRGAENKPGRVRHKVLQEGGQ